MPCSYASASLLFLTHRSIMQKVDHNYFRLFSYIKHLRISFTLLSKDFSHFLQSTLYAIGHAGKIVGKEDSLQIQTRLVLLYGKCLKQE